MPTGDKPKCRRRHAEDKPTETVEQACTRLNWAACLKRAFLYEVLACPCGGRRAVVAAVQDAGEIERFLRHLALWPDTGDIVAIRGPPDLMEPPVDGPEPWDESDPLPADDWAA